MLLTIPDVLSAEQVATCREALAAADWVDGRLTAGHQSERVKRNMQLAGTDPTAQRMGDMILRALERSLRFISAALPLKVFPPLFNRYAGGQTFGTHFDNAILQVPGTPHRLRSDLSATLFLSDPADYDGGELVVEDTYGAHAREAAGRAHGALPGEQPASRQSGHARRAACGVLLDPEHGARRWPAHPAVRPRHRDPACRGRSCPTIRRWCN